VPAVLTLSFDPILQLSGTASVRWETVGLAVVLFVGLALAVRIGSMTPSIGPQVPAPGLRVDDLVFIVVGSVPGAIFGGRLGYVLDHLGYYQANPSAIVDPAQGSLSLTLAVPFGILTASVVARLLGAPISRWMHALALPLLFVLAAGKLVGLLGGSGQGSAVDLVWATAYVGPGPWGSLAAELPSHPSQVYEGIAISVVIAALWFVSKFEVIARRDGALLYAATGLWALARFAVAFTWRDAAVVGPLRMEQVLLLGVVVVSIVGLVERWRAPLHAPVARDGDLGRGFA
jgi:prolipoprotein diacylglyceryltransferase